MIRIPLTIRRSSRSYAFLTPQTQNSEPVFYWGSPSNVRIERLRHCTGNPRILRSASYWSSSRWQWPTYGIWQKNACRIRTYRPGTISGHQENSRHFRCRSPSILPKIRICRLWELPSKRTINKKVCSGFFKALSVQ